MHRRSGNIELKRRLTKHNLIVVQQNKVIQTAREIHKARYLTRQGNPQGKVIYTAR